MKRSGALETGSDTDALFTEQLSNIVRMNTGKGEGNDATFLEDVRFTDDGEVMAKFCFQPFESIGDESLFVGMYGFDSNVFNKINSGTQANDSGNIGVPASKRAGTSL